jgi:cytochrome oxidase Cu insertion factor (SCO1/SenC/PrrC family)
LLTGRDEDISSLAAVLGFKYKKEDDGSFSHSNQIFVLDKEGELEYEHTGLNQDVTDVVSRLDKEL